MSPEAIQPAEDQPVDDGDDGGMPPREKLKYLVEERPLCHPGVFAMYARDYDCPPPEHLRRIYGQVFRGLTRDRVPKKLCHIKPREHGKSEAGTVDNVAWRAISDPSSRSLILSEGADLAEKKLDQVQQIVEDVGGRFGAEVKTSNNSKLELYNNANHGEATVEAAGFGSSITGGHFDLMVYDDLVDWPSQRTEARREKIWKQFQNYLNLGSEGETVVLVLGTRKHPEDLYSKLIENPAWKSIVDKAIQDWSIVEAGEYDLVTLDEDGDEHRHPAHEAASIPPGETIVDAEPHRDVGVLWPERWPLNKLLVDMHAGFGGDQGNLVWRRENQNDAEALQGQVLSEDMLVFVPYDEVPDEGSLRVSWGLDPAVEDDPERAATNDTDYWALAKLGHSAAEDRTYVLDVWRRRGISLSQGLSWVQGKVGRIRGHLLVEDEQAQRWFVQEARDRGMNVRGTKSTGSKEDRIIQMASRFESGRVVLAGDESDWTGPDAKVPGFVNEWAAFPTADHDDRLDSVEIALRDVGAMDVSAGDHDMSDLPV